MEYRPPLHLGVAAIEKFTLDYGRQLYLLQAKMIEFAHFEDVYLGFLFSSK